VMFGVSFLGLAIAGISLIVRLSNLNRRLQAAQNHPTLRAIRAAQGLDTRINAVRSRAEAVAARSARVREATEQIVDTYSLYGLQVERISFATRLLLQTFVPTLRGSMSD